jgi:thioredoxin-like negative regulator of GroEL
MASSVTHSAGKAAPLRRPAAKRATLVFVRRYSSGASRRMESLVAWVKVTRKRQLDVLELDADRHSQLVAKLGVKTAPSLVLVKDRRVVGRLEGRASGRQIDDLIRAHL